MKYLLVAIFMLSDGNLKASYTPFESLAACSANGAKLHASYEALTAEQLAELGVKGLIAYCDPTIRLVRDNVASR